MLTFLDRVVVGKNSEIDGGQGFHHLQPSASVVEVSATDTGGGNRLLRVRRMLGDIRRKAGISAVSTEKGRSGVGG